MNTIEFDDIELEWHGNLPHDLIAIERLLRAEIRRCILPIKPAEMLGTYLVLCPWGSPIIYLYGQEGSEKFHCICFVP